MEVTGLHKSAIIKEALEVGIGVLEHKYGLVSSKRVSEMTEDNLRLLVQQELAGLVKDAIFSSVTLAAQPTTTVGLTEDQLRTIIRQEVAVAVEESSPEIWDDHQYLGRVRRS
jgi:hypothetical protein